MIKGYSVPRDFSWIENYKLIRVMNRNKSKDYQKKYRDNMTDEQKQKKREADKRYKANMTDQQKQKRGNLISDTGII